MTGTRERLHLAEKPVRRVAAGCSASASAARADRTATAHLSRYLAFGIFSDTAYLLVIGAVDPNQPVTVLGVSPALMGLNQHACYRSAWLGRRSVRHLSLTLGSHYRVTSKHELKQRIMAGIDDVNRHPVIHTWSWKLAEATDRMIRTWKR